MTVRKFLVTVHGAEDASFSMKDLVHEALRAEGLDNELKVTVENYAAGNLRDVLERVVTQITRDEEAYLHDHDDDDGCRACDYLALKTEATRVLADNKDAS